MPKALRELGQAPERDAKRVAQSALAGGTNLTIDGTERHRQRPQDKVKQKAHHSGKKKAHMDKNILLVNENTPQVVYLSPTVAGKTHDKKATDDVQIAYPTNATLAKETGFPGDEPEATLTAPQKKAARPRVKRRREVSQHAHRQRARRGRIHAR